MLSCAEFVVAPRHLILAGMAVLAVSGCGAIHHGAALVVEAQVNENPLQRVAEAADSKYYVEWKGDNRLELWAFSLPFSVLVGGWATVHAALDYEDELLTVEFYSRLVGLATLFIPFYSAEGAFAWPNRGGKPPLEEILEWAGVQEGEYTQHKVVK